MNLILQRVVLGVAAALIAGAAISQQPNPERPPVSSAPTESVKPPDSPPQETVKPPGVPAQEAGKQTLPQESNDDDVGVSSAALASMRQNITKALLSQLKVVTRPDRDRRADFDLRITRDGELDNVKLTRASQDTTFDSAVVRAVKASVPFKEGAPFIVFEYLLSANWTGDAVSVALVPKIDDQPSRPALRLDVPPASGRSTFVMNESTKQALRDYESQIGRELSTQPRSRRRPYMRQWAGETELQLTVGMDGQPREAVIFRSSGTSLLDNEALDRFRDARSFPPVPEGLRGREFKANVVVVFRASL